MSGMTRMSKRTGFPVRKYTRRAKKTTFRRGRVAIGKIRRFLPLAGFPEKKFCRLRYVETINMTPGTTLPYAFSTNSCFDPNHTGGGHQPYGFDQWAVIYNHYKVYASVMTLRATNFNAAQSGTIFGIKVDDNAGTTLNINSLMEQKDSIYDVIVAQYSPKLLRKKWSLRKTMDWTRDEVQAQVASSPVDQEYFNIYAGPADPGAQPGVVTFQVQIDYYVLFTELKDFANS